MSEPLRELMDRLADDQPTVRVAPDTFLRGRRARRRGIVLRVAGATAVVAVVAGVAVPLTLSGQDRPMPAPSDLQPAMPDRLHAVHLRRSVRQRGVVPVGPTPRAARTREDRHR